MGLRGCVAERENGGGSGERMAMALREQGNETRRRCGTSVSVGPSRNNWCGLWHWGGM